MLQHRQKVLWYEGMTLDPHHLQQWDRYLLGIVGDRLRSVAPYFWGFTELALDADRLVSGECALVRASGVLPDGHAFDLPDQDDLPPPRRLPDTFEATQPRLGVYLALPAERFDGSNYVRDGAPPREVRFATQGVRVADENTGADEREIEVARARFQLRFEGESMAGYSALKIAEVVRQVGGTFGSDASFVPVSLYLSASDRLMALVRQLLELLAAKGAVLADRQRSILAQRELSPHDAAAMGLLDIVNTYLPTLNHLLHHPSAHPEALHLALATLAGRLATYLPEEGVQPRALPVYDHAEPAGPFNRLAEALQALLGEARPRSNYLNVPLRLERENLYRADVETRVLEQGQLFLVARSSALDETRLVAEVPLKLRVAAPGKIEAVLRAFMRALPVEHTHRLPAGLPVDHQANYFQLLKRGPFWDEIRQDGSLAVFVPPELQLERIDLMAVLDR